MLNGFICLDFKKKIVFQYKEGVFYDISNTVPATEFESKAFILHFLNKGKKECTFKELKEFVDFHGVRKDGRVYATIFITNPYDYISLLSVDKNIDNSLKKVLNSYLEKDKLKLDDKKIRIAAKSIIKDFLKSMESELNRIANE
jgi:hypothetical protein